MTVGKTIILRGLSTDTKPTRYSNGTIFIEYDTGDIYAYNSSTSLWEDANIPYLSVGAKKYGSWTAQSATSGFGGLWLNPTPTAIVVGTGVTNVVRDSTGLRIRYDTGTTINSLSGTRINSVGITERDLNPETHWIIKSTAATDTRIFMGFTSSTAAPVSAADYLANLSGVGFYVDTSIDGNWKIMQNDGSATSNITTLANIGTFGTTKIDLGLRAVNASSKFQYSFSNGAWTDINTKIPAAATGLGWVWYIECLVGSASKQLAFYRGWTKQDG